MVINTIALQAHTGQDEALKSHHVPAAGDLQRWNVRVEPAGRNLSRFGAVRFGQGERDQMFVKSLVLWGDPFGEICHPFTCLLFDPLVFVNLVQWTHPPPSREEAVVSIHVSGDRDADLGSSAVPKENTKEGQCCSHLGKSMQRQITSCLETTKFQSLRICVH